MENLYGIDPEKFIKLRLKCIKPFIKIASKHSLDKNEMIQHAEKAWNDFVIKPLQEQASKTPAKATLAHKS